MVPLSVPVAVSMTVRSAAPQLLTYAFWPSGARATAYGLAPAGMTLTVRVPRSMTDTELDRLLAVQSFVPSAETVRPAGKWLTVLPTGLVSGSGIDAPSMSVPSGVTS